MSRGTPAASALAGWGGAVAAAARCRVGALAHVRGLRRNLVDVADSRSYVKSLTHYTVLGV